MTDRLDKDTLESLEAVLDSMGEVMHVSIPDRLRHTLHDVISDLRDAREDRKEARQERDVLDRTLTTTRVELENSEEQREVLRQALQDRKDLAEIAKTLRLAVEVVASKKKLETVLAELAIERNARRRDLLASVSAPERIREAVLAVCEGLGLCRRDSSAWEAVELAIRSGGTSTGDLSRPSGTEAEQEGPAKAPCCRLGAETGGRLHLGGCPGDPAAENTQAAHDRGFAEAVRICARGSDRLRERLKIAEVLSKQVEVERDLLAEVIRMLPGPENESLGYGSSWSFTPSGLLMHGSMRPKDATSMPDALRKAHFPKHAEIVKIVRELKRQAPKPEAEPADRPKHRTEFEEQESDE